ncbi:VIP2 super family[cl00173] [Acanthamoeba polyphaga moumouvirus]|uniref:VIP2 super family[cl00173] n=2 Tax=Moumouvirus TaxID=3080801 RepID=L7RC13_9VIRU|nr:VIP2 super family[cl00173] [Acanthamoeba polyphaga moumouvirus]AEX63026.1 hypothetical protein mv_L824 [Moumouvirus Monve]AGC01787.1 VIP2 super family[cl00173] [Acanthamoeba polyphaga moumouvirus]AQN68136.1 VIP2 super family protein [Saudi moumouvirus]
MIYYYVSPKNPYKIESTEYIDEIVNMLYSNEAQLISSQQVKELGLSDDYLNKFRQSISTYGDRIPLYDITFNHIYLIYRENVYQRIYNENYRFVDNDFLTDLKNLKDPTAADLDNLRILSNYDLDTLTNTYAKIFYESFVLHKYITNCRRPSFASGMEHIMPYYKINELYYLAYDWNLTNKATLTTEEINGLCKEISKYDISAKTLLDHQLYIYDSRAIGLVKHYSLFGSYYMNNYLRRNQCCLPGNRPYDDVIRNPDLENQIEIMTKLISKAPGFTESHTVYRFVENDSYLQYLKIGDIYQDTSFMSTTRNPFYYKENYAFGYILIKITLPKNIIGVGLCIESYSNFPSEEEIILPPASKYKLINYTDTDEVAHFQNIFNLKVQKKYEFEWVGNSYIGENASEIKINMPGAFIPELNRIDLSDLLQDENFRNIDISDRFVYFKNNYVNMNNQFKCLIGNTEYTFNIGSYDSSSVYKPFFYYELKNGIMISTSNPKYGNINILMELGPEIHINYYFRYSVTDPSIVVDLNKQEWIHWLSLLAFAVGSRNVVIHSNYTLKYNKNDTIEQKQMKTRYTFSENIYLYMKNKIKLFQFDEITTAFDYAQFDYLENLPTEEFINPTDKDELYRIAKSSKCQNLAQLYIYIVEQYPKLIKTFEDKMDTIYEVGRNPFRNVMYNLDPWRYLYDRYLIRRIPYDKDFAFKKATFKKLIGDKKIPKFKNRLRAYLVNK